jgi:virginiamycin B lyase
MITEFAIPTPSSEPERICAGPDGNLWFTETGIHFSGGHFLYNIGRITTSGIVTEFEIPTANSFPQGIARGRDGNLWFTERGIERIGRITPAGVITEFPIPSPSPTAELSLITSGPDGHIWFAQDNRDSLGRFDPATPDRMEEVSIPPRIEVAGFVNGQDGDLWFAELYAHNALVRIDLAATSSSQPIPALSTPMAAALAAALFLAAAKLLRTR